LNPKYPDQDYCQPSFKRHDTDDSASDATTPAFSPDVATQKLENFSDTIQRTRGTRLELSLLSLLSTARSDSAASSMKVTAPLCMVYQLRDVKTYFDAACREPRVRAWLEQESQGFYSAIYLICGFRALIDATVEGESYRTAGLDGDVSVPAALVAGAAGVPVPIPLDVDLASASQSLTNQSNQKVSYKAVGEQVFAVQYMKLRFSKFSSNRVDEAYLQKGSRWKSYLSMRSEEENSEDGFEVDISEPLDMDDLRGSYEPLELDGTTWYCRHKD
jgi:hypothetical protein